MINITRYIINNKSLSPWIKFIWHLDNENANIHLKLLPSECVDVILNLGDNMTYEVGSKKIVAPPFHINGLRSESSYIHHTGNIQIFGISFYQFGLYPFVRKSLIPTQNQITDLFNFSAPLADKLKLAVSATTDIDNIVEAIEKALCSELEVSDENLYNANLFSDFMKYSDNMTINSFCEENKINVKKFERMSLQYTGYTPKILHRIQRFQVATNQLVHHKSSDLLDITYDNHFSDQAHFTKEFHSFAGTTPRTFQQEKQSIKENVVYTYK